MNFIPDTKGIEKLTANDIVDSPEIQKKIDVLKKVLETKPNDINTLLRLAFYYFNGRNDCDAIKFFKRVLEIDPNNVDACVWFSEFFLFTWADAERAIPLLEHALQIDSKRADVHHLLACAFREQHNTIKEKYHLLKSIELEPTWIMDRISLIAMLIDNKEFEAAKKELEKAYSYFDVNFPEPTDDMEYYYENLITGRLGGDYTKKNLDRLRITIDQNLANVNTTS